MSRSFGVRVSNGIFRSQILEHLLIGIDGSRIMVYLLPSSPDDTKGRPLTIGFHFGKLGWIYLEINLSAIVQVLPRRPGRPFHRQIGLMQFVPIAWPSAVMCPHVFNDQSSGRCRGIHILEMVSKSEVRANEKAKNGH